MTSTADRAAETAPRTAGSDGMGRSYLPPAAVAPAFRRWYLPTGGRFVVALASATVWAAIALLLSLSWIEGLADEVGSVSAVCLVALVALVPGHLAAFHAASLLLDRPTQLCDPHPTTAVTVLLAAHNEERTIAETLDYLAAQDYDGELQIVLIDNGSTDGTVIEAMKAIGRNGARLMLLSETRTGKPFALNRGLGVVKTPIVLTLDAGTLLHRSAVRMLVARLQAAPVDVAAVAGHLMVRNSREGLLPRLQAWDYLLGIAAAKRVQALYQGTLVAQGAFSGYRTNSLRRTGGWPVAVGEDIVLTWRLLLGGRVYYEPLALGFTAVPTTLGELGRQRARWARGTLEAFASVPPWRQGRWAVRVLAGADLVLPVLELAYVCALLPGLVLAVLGRLWILGPVAVAVVPMDVVLYVALYRRQRRTVLEPLGLRARRDVPALLLFLTGYQALLSVLSLRGYLQHWPGRHPTWK